MTKEIPLQRDFFSGELVDTRTQSQKKHDQEQAQPRQIDMFAQHEIAQFGVTARPYLPLADKTQLVLTNEDTRTPEQITQDTERQARERTVAMFPKPSKPGEYLPPQRVALLTAGPILLLAANSVVAEPDSGHCRNEYLREQCQVIRWAEERLLYLCLLHDLY